MHSNQASTTTAPQSPDRIRDLSNMPSLPALYAAAVAPRRGPRPEHLPEVAHRVRRVRIAPDRAAAFDHLMGGPATDRAHPGVLHVLAFPVAMSLMTRTDFPAPMLGAVHLANSVLQHRPVRVGEVVDVECRARNLRPHRKGATFEAVSTIVTPDGDIIGTDVSTYLVKGLHVPAGTPEAPAPGSDERAQGDGSGTAHGPQSNGGASRAESGAFTPPPATGRWSLAGDIGRRYAEVSGDVNPIHLSRLTAKALGFPRAIAHGMYTASRAFTEARPDLSRPLRWDVEFAAPVLLPGTVLVRYEDDRTTGATHCVGWRAPRRDESGEERPARRHFTVDVAPVD